MTLSTPTPKTQVNLDTLLEAVTIRLPSGVIRFLNARARAETSSRSDVARRLLMAHLIEHDLIEVN